MNQYWARLSGPEGQPERLVKLDSFRSSSDRRMRLARRCVKRAIRRGLREGTVRVPWRRVGATSVERWVLTIISVAVIASAVVTGYGMLRRVDEFVRFWSIVSISAMVAIFAGLPIAMLIILWTRPRPATVILTVSECAVQCDGQAHVFAWDQCTMTTDGISGWRLVFPGLKPFLVPMDGRVGQVLRFVAQRGGMDVTAAVRRGVNRLTIRLLVVVGVALAGFLTALYTIDWEALSVPGRPPWILVLATVLILVVPLLLMRRSLLRSAAGE